MKKELKTLMKTARDAASLLQDLKTRESTISKVLTEKEGRLLEERRKNIHFINNTSLPEIDQVDYILGEIENAINPWSVIALANGNIAQAKQLQCELNADAKKIDAAVIAFNKKCERLEREMRKSTDFKSRVKEEKEIEKVLVDSRAARRKEEQKKNPICESCGQYLPPDSDSDSDSESVDEIGDAD